MATCKSRRIDHARRLGGAHRELERRLTAGLNKTMDEPDPVYACVQRTMVDLLLHRSLEPDERPASEEARATSLTEADACRDLEDLLDVGVNAAIHAPDPTLAFAQRIQTELLLRRTRLVQQPSGAAAGGEAGATSLGRADEITRMTCDAFAPLARVALELTLTPAIGALAEVFDADDGLASEQCAAAVAKLFNRLWGQVRGEMKAATKHARLERRVGEAALHELKLVNKVTTTTEPHT